MIDPDRKPDVEAIVRLLPADEGGLQRPALSGYRPAHAVRPDYLTSGIHRYLDCSAIAPGQSARAHITFITPEHYPESLWTGKVIAIQEGGRLVGTAEIVEVFNPQLRGEASE